MTSVACPPLVLLGSHETAHGVTSAGALPPRSPREGVLRGLRAGISVGVGWGSALGNNMLFT